MRGLFTEAPPAEFGEMSYAEEVEALHKFAADLTQLISTLQQMQRRHARARSRRWRARRATAIGRCARLGRSGRRSGGAKGGGEMVAMRRGAAR